MSNAVEGDHITGHHAYITPATDVDRFDLAQVRRWAYQVDRAIWTMEPHLTLEGNPVPANLTHARQQIARAATRFLVGDRTLPFIAYDAIDFQIGFNAADLLTEEPGYPLPPLPGGMYEESSV